MKQKSNVTQRMFRCQFVPREESFTKVCKKYQELYLRLKFLGPNSNRIRILKTSTCEMVSPFNTCMIGIFLQKMGIIIQNDASMKPQYCEFWYESQDVYYIAVSVIVPYYFAQNAHPKIYGNILEDVSSSNSNFHQCKFFKFPETS